MTHLLSRGHMYQPSAMLSILEKDILDLALEDCTRLTDVFALVKHRLPGRENDAYVLIGQSLVRKLVQLNYLEVWWEDGGGSFDAPRSFTKVPASEVEQVLDEKSNWLPEHLKLHGINAGVQATDAAEKAMYE